MSKVQFIVLDGERVVSIGRTAPEIIPDGAVVVGDGFAGRVGERFVEGENRTEPFPVEPEPETYIDQRAAAYPPLSDLADALYWREHGNPALLDAWLSACAAVKTRFPKD